MNLIHEDLFNLKGKTAIVTGGLGILGKRFCEGLAKYGANIAVIDLDEEKVVSFSRHLTEEYGVRSVGIECDITSKDSIKRMIEKVVSTLGNILILLNNAAWKSDDLDAFFTPFEEYSLETWRKVMAVNIDAMFMVAQSVAKQMIKQSKGGSIIQTSSIYGILGPDERIYQGSHYLGRAINTPPAYTASKASVVGFSKYLATYLAKYNIRVNTLTPGGVESGQNETFKQKYAQRVPLGRMAKAEEIVGAVIFLASDASSYVTGQNIIVDGGLSAW